MLLINIIRNDVANTILKWVGAKQGGITHKNILKIYNSNRPLPRNYAMTINDAWCAATVSAAWIASHVSKITPIECSCSKLIELAKEMKIWEEKDNYKPNVGDAVLYDWDDGNNYATTDNKGVPEHVGMVVEVNGNKFVVVEGNKNKAVGKRNMTINGKYIRGFITPKYHKIVTVVNEVIDGKWGNGEERRNKLKADGWDATYIQSLVNKQIIACNNVAHEVIEGLWGNGEERKNRLKAAGYPYKFVQSLVNAYLQSGG